jgi:hypothetical protein
MIDHRLLYLTGGYDTVAAAIINPAEYGGRDKPFPKVGKK